MSNRQLLLTATALQPVIPGSLDGSRLNAKNALDTRPYCNRQLLKKILRIERTAKIYQHEIFYANHF